MNDLEHFRRVAGDNLLRAWLEKQLEDQVRTLAAATDTALLHRAQGAYAFVLRQLDLLEKAKNLR